MRQIWAILLTVLSIAPELSAKSTDDWAAVVHLRWDTPVVMELWNGQEYVGRFDSADSGRFRMKLRDATSAGSIVMREFPREQVRIVERPAEPPSPPYGLIRGGQIAGGIGGAVAAGIATGHAWPFGAVVGGLGGMAAGTLVGGAAGLVMMSKNSHAKIVYQAHKQPPVARPPADQRPMPHF
jgi:hypothetical protein